MLGAGLNHSHVARGGRFMVSGHGGVDEILVSLRSLRLSFLSCGAFLVIAFPDYPGGRPSGLVQPIAPLALRTIRGQHELLRRVVHLCVNELTRPVPFD